MGASLRMRVSNEWLAVDANAVVQIIGAPTPRALHAMHPAIVGLVPFRGRAICAVDLAQRRGGPSSAPFARMVVVRVGEAMFALCANAVHEVTDDDARATPISLHELASELIDTGSA
jgi:chemotaxis signal transduction protein